MTFLSKSDFTSVIKNTPLVSIDLVVENECGQILLGYRNNRPAQGWWFVPGGRILKNERMDDAFARLAKDELGLLANRSSATMINAFEHFYDDSVFGASPSTHYVVLGYHIKVKETDLRLPMGLQHEKYRWFAEHELNSENNVHQHTLDYFPLTN